MHLRGPVYLSFFTPPLPLPLFSHLVRYADASAQASNATSWERPVKEGASVSGQLAGANPNSTGTGGKGKDGGGSSATTGKPEGGGPPLPAGWTEVKDPKTGEVYYWNQVRRRTGREPTPAYKRFWSAPVFLVIFPQSQSRSTAVL